MSADNPPSKKLNPSDAVKVGPADKANESEPSMLSQNQEGDWVDDSLRKLYTSTLEEDIPLDMLSLLDQLDEAADASDGRKETKDKEANQ
jgi:hypothetical protein